MLMSEWVNEQTSGKRARLYVNVRRIYNHNIRIQILIQKQFCLSNTHNIPI